MSTIRSLQLPEQVRPAWLSTPRGDFAALEAQPARGVADRRPALLIHGYTGSKENFLPVLEPLALAGRTVIAVDLRGQYHSPHAADAAGYSPAAVAADVRAIAAAVAGQGGTAHGSGADGSGADGSTAHGSTAHGSGGLHLVGHSLGGLLAREAVLQEPADFLSLTLLGSGPATIAGQRADDLRELLAVLDPDSTVTPADRGRLGELVRIAWQSRHEPAARAEGISEDIIAFLRDRALRTDPVSLIALGRYLLGAPDRTAELAELIADGLAVQVVYGENDDAWPPAEQDLMARWLGAERTCIPGAAHSPAIEAPETTASVLTEFWNAAEHALPTVHSCGRTDRHVAPDPVAARAS